MSEKKVGLPSKPAADKRSRWVQTEASAHEAWARLILKHRGAAAFMHMLVSRMDRNTNAVVASYNVLAKLLGCSPRSVKNYIDVLVKDKWIQVVSLGKGATNAYVVNSMVAWSQNRESLKYSTFSAQVIADADDQDQTAISTGDLRKIPVLFSGDEQQLPTGVRGTEPPVQTLLDGTEPELPSIRPEQQRELDI
ncbi:helix-turn-helix domain-containing protein [Pseudoalteromonas sp. MelDa3]|uniref:helix-turn-helix domain-containing protein n=1 Tax=Pseudoalteromonas sp. MelDa3 TaxID=888435 RepID=UPI000EFCAC9D|nr:helix-turn-helix domain-containing protein [Pseudoalteromonas sp. MelDa3]